MRKTVAKILKNSYFCILCAVAGTYDLAGGVPCPCASFNI